MGESADSRAERVRLRARDCRSKGRAYGREIQDQRAERVRLRARACRFKSGRKMSDLRDERVRLRARDKGERRASESMCEMSRLQI